MLAEPIHSVCEYPRWVMMSDTGIFVMKTTEISRGYAHSVSLGRPTGIAFDWIMVRNRHGLGKPITNSCHGNGQALTTPYCYKGFWFKLRDGKRDLVRQRRELCIPPTRR
jgi:hypothetical protein